MKKYVFSFINFHDNDLTSKVIESDLDMTAVVINELEARSWEVTGNGSMSPTIQDLKNFAFDCDSMFNIIEI